MKLTFYGAARAVTGSNFLLETKGKRILIDCGLFQGTWFSQTENARFQYDPKQIDAVLLTHAHADHSGRLPKLSSEGFNGPVYCTKPTKDLTKLILLDAVKIMQHEAEEFGASILFSESDVVRLMKQFKTVGYSKRTRLFDNIFVTFYNAGHILGSAFLVVETEGKRIAFSGDMGNSPVPILPDHDRLPMVEYVVCETTYGNRIHEDTQYRSELLQKIIIEVMGRGGVLIIPVFAMERTQEILYELNAMVEHKKIPRVPIYLDSPLAIDMTEVYKKYVSFYDEEAKYLVRRGDDIFNFPRLVNTRSKDDSKSINNAPTPKIIVSSSGFGTGGRILHHFKRYLSDAKNCVVMVSWQIPGTLGRALKDGERAVTVLSERIRVRAEIQSIGGYSAHADMPGLISFLRPSKESIKKVFLTHGEEDQMQAFRNQVTTDLHLNVVIPKFKQSFEF